MGSAKGVSCDSISSAAPALQNDQFDGELERLIELWPMLVSHDRATLLANAEHLIAQQNRGSVAGR